jgi:hypothetical protein
MQQASLVSSGLLTLFMSQNLAFSQEALRQSLDLDRLQVDATGKTLQQRLLQDNFDCPTTRSTSLEPGFTGRVVCPGHTWIDPSDQQKKHWLSGIKNVGSGIVIATAEMTSSDWNYWGIHEYDATGAIKYRDISRSNFNPQATFEYRQHAQATLSHALGNGWGWDYWNSNPAKLANIAQVHSGPGKCYGRLDSYLQRYLFVENRLRDADQSKDYTGPAWDVRGNLDQRGMAPGATFSRTIPNEIHKTINPDWDVLFRSDLAGTVSDWNLVSSKLGGKFPQINYYTNTNQEHDQFLSNHNSNHRIMVNSGGNNGSTPTSNSFNNAQGFFSMGYNGKNAIIVGLNNNDAPLTKSDISSMGPTRDGRVGMTVLAPGSHAIGPSQLNYLRDESGNIKKFDGTQCDAIDINGATEGKYTWGATGGTSNSGPVVAGIVAIMLENYRDHVLGGGSLKQRKGFWQSTVRGILIHTATDMTHTSPYWDRVLAANQQDRFDPTVHDLGAIDPMPAPGPDWATGYGLINPEKAFAFSRSSNLFKESAIQNKAKHTYAFDVNQSNPMRITLAWDDPEWPTSSALDAFVPHLMNDLDLKVISPSGKVYEPWNLDGQCLYLKGLPRVAATNGIEPITRQMVNDCQGKKGIDRVNNNEVVDFTPNESGIWTVEVYAHKISKNQSLKVSFGQDYSLISDQTLRLTSTTAGEDPTQTIYTNNQILNMEVSEAWLPSDGSSNKTGYSYTADSKLWIKTLGANYTPVKMQTYLHEPLINDLSATRAELHAKIGIDYISVGSTLPPSNYYYGNLQFFLDSHQDGIYNEYLGQAEIWCDRSTCIEEREIAIPLPDSRNLIDALKTGSRKRLHIVASTNSGLAQTMKYSLDEIRFVALPGKNLRQVSWKCSDANIYDGSVPSTDKLNKVVRISKPPFGGSYDMNKARYFECKVGATSPWCSSKSYAPSVIKLDPMTITPSTYWPSAWEEVKCVE